MGVSENLGNAMIFKALKDDTQKMVFWPNVHPGNDTITSSLCVNPDATPAIIKSRQEIF